MSDYDWSQHWPTEDDPIEYGPKRDPWQVYPKELEQDRAAKKGGRR